MGCEEKNNHRKTEDLGGKAADWLFKPALAK